MIAIRPAVSADRALIAAMMARAFQDDPAFAFIFPDATDRARRLPRLFSLLFDSDGRTGMRFMTEDGAAATLWRPPGRNRVGGIEMLMQAPALIAALGGNIVRALRVARAIEAHLDASSCWYLHYAACDPARQGQGLGTAAIHAGLEQIGDAPVYLETACERNVSFYRQLGFAVIDQWRAGPDGPRFHSMMRG